jgi:hypothetical protein
MGDFVNLDGRDVCLACGEPPEAGHHPSVCHERVRESVRRLDTPEHAEQLRQLYDAEGLGRRRPAGGRVASYTMTDGTELELVGWPPGGATFTDEPEVPVGGLDPAMLEWAARWCTSIATLTREGFAVYERDGFGELQLVGIDADGGLIDASDSLERLRACSRALERRGLAGLGWGLAARPT